MTTLGEDAGLDRIVFDVPEGAKVALVARTQAA